MKRLAAVLAFIAVFFVVAAACAVDRAAVSKNVDDIVAGLESGKDAMAYKADTYDPYAFILEESGTLLVHPTLAGKSLKEAAPPAYAAVMQATTEGAWVKYEWKGKEKNTYVKKTANHLIVGSGY